MRFQTLFATLALAAEPGFARGNDAGGKLLKIAERSEAKNEKRSVASRFLLRFGQPFRNVR